MKIYELQPKLLNRRNLILISTFTLLGTFGGASLVNAQGNQKVYAAERVATFLEQDLREPKDMEIQRLLRAVRPMVLRNGKGSMTVVARTNAGEALGFSAMHVAKSGKTSMPIHQDPTKPTMTYELVNEVPPLEYEMLDVGPEISTPDQVTAHPAWRIFQPRIQLTMDTSGANPQISDIMPEVDFTVIRVGMERLSLGSAGNSIPSDSKIKAVMSEKHVNKNWPADLPFEPGSHNTRPAIQGEEVVLIGYPEENRSDLSFSTGQIAAPALAGDLVRGSNDTTENKIEFDPKIEGLVLGYGSTGFSGGAVFGMDGKFLGVLQRAQIPNNKMNPEIVPYVRFLTAEAIFGKLAAASPELKAFLGKNLQELITATQLRISKRGGSAGPLDPSSPEARRIRSAAMARSCKNIFSQ